MNDRIRFPFKFDATQLQQDLGTLQDRSSEWIDHFVKQNYEGDWSVIPLRGPKGATHPVMMIYSDPTCEEFENTPFVTGCPYFAEVLNTFKTEVQAARLMKLATGSVIKEHRDHDLEFDLGIIRVHIPVVTNPQVEFYLNGTRVIMNEGECWYLKLADPHRVTNPGPNRVHLVIDMKVNDWVGEMLKVES